MEPPPFAPHLDELLQTLERPDRPGRTSDRVGSVLSVRTISGDRGKVTEGAKLAGRRPPSGEPAARWLILALATFAFSFLSVLALASATALVV